MNNNSYYGGKNNIPQSHPYLNKNNGSFGSNQNFSMNPNDERFGFLGPFLLGGITGGLVAPLFYGGQRPYYYNNYYYPPYPYYRPPYYY